METHLHNLLQIHYCSTATQLQLDMSVNVFDNKYIKRTSRPMLMWSSTDITTELYGDYAGFKINVKRTSATGGSDSSSLMIDSYEGMYMYSY